MRIRKFALITILSAMVLAAAGCSVSVNTNGNDDYNTDKNNAAISETKNETKEIELKGAQNVKTKIDFGVGKLNLKGGADKLMKAEFTYNVPSWKPIVDYNVNGTQGNLVIKQPSNTKSVNSNVKYEWNVSLNSSIPMDINAELGVGNSNFDLSNVNIKNADIKIGVGNMDLYLCGDYKSDVTAAIEGGVGSTDIYLPKNMGVKIKADKGVGKIRADGFILNGDEYVNEAYGKSKFNINLKIECGVGDINLKLK